MHTTPMQQQEPPRSHRAAKRRPRWLIAAIVVAVLAIGGAIIEAVGGDGQEPEAAVASAAPSRQVVPTPDAGQAAAYLAALERIDPGLVANAERAIRRGRSICDRIINPRGGTMTLEEYVVAELSGGNATIDEAQARQVIRAVKVWCPAGS